MRPLIPVTQLSPLGARSVSTRSAVLARVAWFPARRFVLDPADEHANFDRSQLCRMPTLPSMHPRLRIRAAEFGTALRIGGAKQQFLRGDRVTPRDTA